MKIYRVEYDNHRGPYNPCETGDEQCQRDMRQQRQFGANMAFAHSNWRDNRHPGPYDAFGYYPAKSNEKFGFMSHEALVQWFGPYLLAALALGAHIRILDTEKDPVKLVDISTRSDGQVLFADERENA